MYKSLFASGQPYAKSASLVFACSCTQCECACASILTIMKNAISLCAHFVHEHAQNELSLLAYSCTPANKLLHKILLDTDH